MKGFLIFVFYVDCFVIELEGVGVQRRSNHNLAYGLRPHLLLGERSKGGNDL